MGKRAVHYNQGIT